MKVSPLVPLIVAAGFGSACARLTRERELAVATKTGPAYETRRPTNQPTSSPTTCPIPCETNYDCPMTCHKKNIYAEGVCVRDTPGTPTRSPVTPPPTTCVCKDPSNIPDKCEVDILIDEMEIFVSASHELLAQWTRAAFHDAGTHDQTMPEGGANGCLLTHPPMRLQSENNFLDAPLNTLQAIKDFWHAHPDTCIDVSSADMLQFAIFFAVTRQSGVPGLTAAKRDQIKAEFLWGRPDEPNCDVTWTDNLPGFTTPASGGPIPARCTAAGGEIKDKLMDRNGFTEEEATVLIGAHTIGLVRNTFGAGLAGPWVTNGDDNATPQGPVFDNAYHDFLINTIVENTAPAFAGNVAPFTIVFPDWFRDHVNDLDHLDTDVALAFPSLNLGVHPDFHVHSTAFSVDNALFIKVFYAAMQKMGQLGVSVPLFLATECEEPCGSGAGIELDDAMVLISKLGNATAYADKVTRVIQKGRQEEIARLTKPQVGDFFNSADKPQS